MIMVIQLAGQWANMCLLSISIKKKRFQGKMYACERDPERQNTLHNIIKLAGARVEVIAKDVFEIKKGMMDDVEYILLDPSCSGSGNWLQ